jgi:hypothetical protein
MEHDQAPEDDQKRHFAGLVTELPLSKQSARPAAAEGQDVQRALRHAAPPVGGATLVVAVGEETNETQDENESEIGRDQVNGMPPAITVFGRDPVSSPYMNEISKAFFNCFG